MSSRNAPANALKDENRRASDIGCPGAYRRAFGVVRLPRKAKWTKDPILDTDRIIDRYYAAQSALWLKYGEAGSAARRAALAEATISDLAKRLRKPDIRIAVAYQAEYERRRKKK